MYTIYIYIHYIYIYIEREILETPKAEVICLSIFLDFRNGKAGLFQDQVLDFLGKAWWNSCKMPWAYETSQNLFIASFCHQESFFSLPNSGALRPTCRWSMWARCWAWQGWDASLLPPKMQQSDAWKWHWNHIDGLRPKQLTMLDLLLFTAGVVEALRLKHLSECHEAHSVLEQSHWGYLRFLEIGS